MFHSLSGTTEASRLEDRQLLRHLLLLHGWGLKDAARHAGYPSHTGLRDYLDGIPQRLSAQKLSRLWECLCLGQDGRLVPEHVYRWSVVVDQPSLEALKAVLTDMASGVGPDARWTVSPFLGSTFARWTTQFWAFSLTGYCIVVQWSPGMATDQQSLPGLDVVGPVVWHQDMGVEGHRARGILPSPPQLATLLDPAAVISAEEVRQWVNVKPVDECAWKKRREQLNRLTWRDLDVALRVQYPTPAEVAMRLGLVPAGEDEQGASEADLAQPDRSSEGMGRDDT